MSHSPTVFTPAGTPTIDRTVGEIVAESPSLARVFQSFKIDFCCQGGRTLREACEIKGISADTLVEQLEAAMKTKPETEANPALLPPIDLVNYIVATHHDYLRAELPRIDAMAARVAKVHGGHTSSLVEVYEVFHDMASELIEHTNKEEMALFPAIKAIARGERAMPLDAPITCMLQEHDDAGAALEKLRVLTHDFTPPLEACNTYRALFAGLAELETDLHTHIHLENSVLFPAALAMVKNA